MRRCLGCGRTPAAYLDHRHRQWLATANPHLFVHFRTATTTAHVGHRWINLQLGPHLTTHALRNDRLLHEALATDGDAKRLGDLFGLSTRAARRSTKSLEHPDLRHQRPGAGHHASPATTADVAGTPRPTAPVNP
ncbi:hypothetical protein GCM10027073_63170 [Streptomyces chlorus]|uniref:Uncharacterized protein n=1 Tax=Streptomyces chlorus TaxID=887452 RepID=A0ABW1E030_9ACTN